jgi:hypothetical protein
LLGRRAPVKKACWTLAQLVAPPSTGKFQPRAADGRRWARANTATRSARVSPDLLCSTVTGREMVAGDFFGEIAALSHAADFHYFCGKRQAELLEIRWRGLLDAPRRSVAATYYQDLPGAGWRPIFLPFPVSPSVDSSDAWRADQLRLAASGLATTKRLAQAGTVRPERTVIVNEATIPTA